MSTERASGPSRFLGTTARIVLLTVVLVTVQGLGSRFIPAPDPAVQPSEQPSAGFLAIVVAVALLQTIALAYPTLRSRWHGWWLVGTVFIMYFGTVTS